MPIVAHTKQGTRPARRSCSICRASTSGRMAKFSSTSISRKLSRPSPAIRTSFSTEECACDDVYATNFPSQPRLLLTKSVARSRAASKAHRDALEAVSWITPPPLPLERNFRGRSSISTSQSSTWVSSSVQAGLVAQSIPCTPRPEESKSPRMAGPEALAGKNAKKFGDCQWVTPGRISFSTSPRIATKDSPFAGGFAGNEARTCPGSARDNTGYDSIRP